MFSYEEQLRKDGVVKTYLKRDIIVEVCQGSNTTAQTLCVINSSAIMRVLGLFYRNR